MKARHLALIAGLALLLLVALWQAGEAARSTAGSPDESPAAPAASPDTTEGAKADGTDSPTPLPPPEATDRSTWSPGLPPAALAGAPAATETLALEPNCLGHPITINGTAGTDFFSGTPFDDVIHGQGGDDIINGGGGDDIICGGDGDDGLNGNDGDDTLDGGAGDDGLGGADGNDSVSGGAGSDGMSGGPGNDTIDGGLDWDWIYYYSAAGPVTLSFASGTATGEGNDTLIGIEGVMGSDFDDFLTAGPSGNSLGGVGGNDTLIGGAGRDEAGYWWAPDGVTVDLATGTASGEGSDTLTGIENVAGSVDYGDVLAGEGGDNSLSGFGGNDTLSGRAGWDYLDGGSDTDTCLTGEGLFSCELPPSISGTVTDEASGDPLSDICVDVSGDYWAESVTDSSGYYRIGGLPSGDYRVQFRDCRPTPTYVTEWYDGKEDFDSADLVSLTAGSETGGIDAALVVGGSISGTVTDDATGDPLSDICVDVYDASHSWLGYGYTDPSGHYVVGGLPSGDYKVHFYDCWSPITYVSEWYDDKEDFESADPVPVTAGSDTGGIDAALAVGGSISGTVTDESTGDPLSDICIDVYDTSHNQVGWGDTDSSGYYSVGGLPSGDYRVEFRDCNSPVIYVSEWYNNKSDFDSADPVSVTLGSETGGIDAALVVGGSISGTVTDESTGDPLSDICVEVCDTSYNWAGSGNTDPSGQYAIGGLPSGDYRVDFRDCNSPVIYVSEWYDDKEDFSSADVVSVTLGSETGGIDAALALGGSISGTVTDDATGDPLSNICVNASDASQSWGGSGQTDSTGQYTIGGLPSGDYKVEFWDCRSTVIYVSEWYDDKEDFSSADVVSVTLGSETGGIDAALALGGSISGTVTDEATGDPLSDICADVVGDYWVESVTDSSGHYVVGGLPSGDYRVEFRDCNSTATYVSEWYDDKPNFDSADLVPVTLRSETGGIDAALALGGSISGTVTDEATGDPLSDICVDVYDASHSWLGYGHTDPSGHYVVGGLPSGDYKVEFWECSFPHSYLSEWYDDKPDFDSADLVPVTLGAETGGIDAALALGGSISGTVTDDATGDPLSDICVGVYDTSHNQVGWGDTDSSGYYSVGGLPSGDYWVQFWDCSFPHSYLSEWYDDKPDFDSADLVPVTAGSDTGGVDAALALPVGSIGIYQPSGGLWFLRNANSSGMADLTFSYGAGISGAVSVVGDWDGYGIDIIGIYQPSSGLWFLRNDNSSGVADLTFSYGAGISGGVAVVGDWDGDGTDTIGIYRPSDGQWFLRNENSSGVADLTFSYGAGISGGVAIVGDWDGDGTDTIGIYRASDGMWFLRNDNSSGVADLTFSYGAGISGGVAIVGDWDGDGTDTIGIYQPSTGQWFLRNDNSSGVADLTFSYGAGISGGVAVVGDWDGS